MRRRGFTLAELCVTGSMLVMLSAVTTVLYRDTLGTIGKATGLMDARFTLRQAISRVVPLLETAYVPPIAGASRCFEQAQGPKSFLFYSPVDLVERTGLLPLSEQVPHLFELRLQGTELLLQPCRVPDVAGGTLFPALPRPARTVVHGLSDFSVTPISSGAVSVGVEKNKLRVETQVFFPVVTN